MTNILPTTEINLDILETLSISPTDDVTKKVKDFIQNTFNVPPTKVVRLNKAKRNIFYFPRLRNFGGTFEATLAVITVRTDSLTVDYKEVSA